MPLLTRAPEAINVFRITQGAIPPCPLGSPGAAPTGPGNMELWVPLTPKAFGSESQLEEATTSGGRSG